MKEANEVPQIPTQDTTLTIKENHAGGTSFTVKTISKSKIDSLNGTLKPNQSLYTQ